MTYPDFHNVDLIKKFLFKRGFTDISSYKEKYFLRRLTIRMRKRTCNSYANYYDILSKDTKEINFLKKILSVNVTEFFRDFDTWEEFQKLLSKYVKNKGYKNLTPSLRIWSAACAVGAEPYSIACVTHHVLGNNLLKFNVKIQATDFNEELLQIARRGIYEGEILKNISNDYLIKYFERLGKGYRVKYAVKRLINFSYLDLTADKFMFKKNGTDIIFCRNVLIYFAKELQERIIRKYYDILVPGGILILGRTEILPAALRNSFEPLTLKHRMYQKLDAEPLPMKSKRNQIKKFKCSICGENFDNLVDLRLHERKQTCSKFRCSKCFKAFEREIRLKAHLKYFH